MSELPDFSTAPAWLDCCGFAWSREEYGGDEDSASRHAGSWTPLRTAGDWASRIDRDELAERLADWYDRSDRIGFEGVADAMLAALPELTKEEA